MGRSASVITERFIVEIAVKIRISIKKLDKKDIIELSINDFLPIKTKKFLTITLTIRE
jgi:hypothetical protein